MSQTLLDDIEDIRALLAEKEQASGDLSRALQKARRRLPRRIYNQGQKLAHATPLLRHPFLRLTLDEEKLMAAAREVSAHLKGVDLAERRKDRLLGILGSVAISVLMVAVLLIVVLRWRGFV